MLSVFSFVSDIPMLVPATWVHKTLQTQQNIAMPFSFNSRFTTVLVAWKSESPVEEIYAECNTGWNVRINATLPFTAWRHHQRFQWIPRGYENQDYTWRQVISYLALVIGETGTSECYAKASVHSLKFGDWDVSVVRDGEPVNLTNVSSEYSSTTISVWNAGHPWTPCFSHVRVTCWSLIP